MASRRASHPSLIALGGWLLVSPALTGCSGLDLAPPRADGGAVDAGHIPLPDAGPQDGGRSRCNPENDFEVRGVRDGQILTCADDEERRCFEEWGWGRFTVSRSGSIHFMNGDVNPCEQTLQVELQAPQDCVAPDGGGPR